MRVLREMPWIKIDIRNNNLAYEDDEESFNSPQSHFLPEKLERLERDCDETRRFCISKVRNKAIEVQQRLFIMEEEKAGLEGFWRQLSIENSIVRQKESILQAQLLELRELQAVITDPALTSRILELEQQVRDQREDCAKIEARINQIVLEISEQECIVAREREEFERLMQTLSLAGDEETVHLTLRLRGGGNRETRFSDRSESIFEENLRIVQERVRSGVVERMPTVFIHYASAMSDKEFINFLYEDLVRVGLPSENVFCERVAEDSASVVPGEILLETRVEKIKTADWVFLIGSPELKNQYDSREIIEDDAGFSEIDMIRIRDALREESRIVLINQDCDQQSDIFPASLQYLEAKSFAWNYTSGFFNLLKDMGIAEG